MSHLTLKNVTDSLFTSLPQVWQPALTDVQKRVAVIAIALFACLAVWWIAKHCCCQEIKVSSHEDNQPIDPPKQLDHQKELDQLLDDVGGERDFYKKIIKITGYDKDPEDYLKRWKQYKDHPEAYEDQVKLLFRKGKANKLPPSESDKWEKAIIATGILVDPEGYLAQWKLERGTKRTKAGILIRAIEDALRQRLKRTLTPKAPTEDFIKTQQFLESIGIGKDYYQDQGIGISQKSYTRIMSMTGYSKSPTTYIERWKEYRDHIKVFEQKAETLKQKLMVAADEYSKNGPQFNRSTEQEEYSRALFFEYGCIILETGILVNPKEYLKNWKLARGGSEECRDPEDDLRQFFKQELLL